MLPLCEPARDRGSAPSSMSIPVHGKDSSGSGWPKFRPAGGRLWSSFHLIPSSDDSAGASARTGPSFRVGLPRAVLASVPKSSPLSGKATANPFWGAPRIHGELLKLGLDVSERTVSRLIPKRRSPPSQTWRTFLANHVRDLVAFDFFTVPTARLRVLFVLVVLAHHRRRVVHFNVTEHPTAAWTAQQMVDAFPDESAPAYLLRDRDRVYGQPFRHRLKGMGIEEVLTAPQSPWQNPFAERLIGSIRRGCLNHVARPRRATPPPHPDPIPRLLPSGAYPPRAGQRRTRPQADRAPGDREDRAASRSRRPAPPLRPPSRIVQPLRSYLPLNA
jgi:hypothetical protein